MLIFYAGKWFHLFLSNMNNSNLLIICLRPDKFFKVLLCIINNSHKHQSFIYTQLSDQTVLFQTIPFSISTVFCLHTVEWSSRTIPNNSFEINNTVYTSHKSFWPIDRTLSGATTPCQTPGSDNNEKVLSIPQNSSITIASPSDSLLSYPGHILREPYPFAEKQSVYSAAPGRKYRILSSEDGVGCFSLEKNPIVFHYSYKIFIRKRNHILFF